MKRFVFILLTLILVVSTPIIGDTKPNKAYFDKGTFDPTIELINNATSSIHVEMFNFTNYPPPY